MDIIFYDVAVYCLDDCSQLRHIRRMWHMQETNLCSHYRYKGKGSLGCRLDSQRPRQWGTAVLVDMASQIHICEARPLGFYGKEPNGK